MSSDAFLSNLQVERNIKDLSRYYEDKIRLYELRLTAVYLLRALKEIMGYTELSKIFDINTSLLCRYVKGHVIPSIDVSNNIIFTSIQRGLISKLIRKSYEETGSNLINPNLFRFISEQITDIIDFSYINKIVSFFPKDAVLGISLSLNTGKKLIFAYNDKHFFPEKYYELVFYIKSKLGNEEIKRTVAIPKNTVKNNDKLAIVGFYLNNVEDYIWLIKLLKRIKINVEVANCVFVTSPNDNLLKIFTEEVNKCSKECSVIILSKLA